VAIDCSMELRDVQFVIRSGIGKRSRSKKRNLRELAMASRSENDRGHEYLRPFSQRARPMRPVSPEHVIGLHFFNPVSRMKLVESGHCKNRPSDDNREAAVAFARQIGKLAPVIVATTRVFWSTACCFRICSMPPSFSRAGFETRNKIR